MIIFKDRVTGDELFSDTYRYKETDGGIFYEVDGKRVTETSDMSGVNIGGNASAEEETEEAAEASSVSGCNIVLANRLVQTRYAKKDYRAYIKGYMKKISEHLTEDNPDRLPGFKAAAQAAVKRILDTFDDWEFFMGESMGEGGMIALMNYREDGVTPFMLFFKDGVVEEKV